MIYLKYLTVSRNTEMNNIINLLNYITENEEQLFSSCKNKNIEDPYYDDESGFDSKNYNSIRFSSAMIQNEFCEDFLILHTNNYKPNKTLSITFHRKNEQYYNYIRKFKKNFSTLFHKHNYIEFSFFCEAESIYYKDTNIKIPTTEEELFQVQVSYSGAVLEYILLAIELKRNNIGYVNFYSSDVNLPEIEYKEFINLFEKMKI